MTMLYLLGFPTPVVEIYLLLVVMVLGIATYFGLAFEDVEIRDPARGEPVEEDESVTEVSG
jgi:hypothetical protein